MLGKTCKCETARQKEEVGVVPQTNERYLLVGSPGGGVGEVGKDQIIRGLVCQA